MIGRTLGHYELLERLGAGGMGVVYRARDTRLQREVAIKVLPPGLLADDTARRRFRAEALALSRLDHPNIVTVFDFDHQDEIDFLVIQLVHGRSLDKRLEEGPLPEAEAVGIGAQIADALSFAHQHGVIHRDIKPSNILITDEERVKLVDFGIARLLASEDAVTLTATQPGAVRGTLPYIAPEALSGHADDVRVDLYSLGVVLYEMGAGHLPFDAREPTTLMREILVDSPPPPRKWNPKLSARYEEIVGEAMRRDPADRPRDAAAMTVALRELGKRIIAGAPPVAASRRTWPLVRRRLPGWRIAGAVAAAILLIIVGSRQMFRTQSREHSLAILPFTNAMADPDAEFLSDGLTEALINNMSMAPHLKVIARSSVFQYKGQQVDVRQVGRALDVRTVLLGRVQRNGQQLAISVELIDARGNYQLWGDRFETRRADMESAPKRIAVQVASVLHVQLPTSAGGTGSSTVANQARAFELYLRGRYHAYRMIESESERAIQYFQQAIDTAPDFALPYVGLADCYYFFSNWHLPPDVAMPKARSAAQRALVLDPGSAEAYATLGIVLGAYDWKWVESEQLLRKSIRLNPGYATAHFYLGYLLLSLGNNAESRAEFERARELDPLSSVMAYWATMPLVNTRRYDEAARELNAILDADPSFASALNQLSGVYVFHGRNTEALGAIDRMLQKDRSPAMLSAAGYTYGRCGRRQDAISLTDSLKHLSLERYVAPSMIGRIYVALGEADSAMVWLERGLLVRDEGLMLIGVDPYFDPIRADVRFQRLVRRIGPS